MRKILIIGLSVLFVNYLSATETNSTGNKKGHIVGSIIDASDGQPVEYATVALYKRSDESLVSGGISDLDGFFRIKDNPKGEYYLTITFMGYKTIDIPNIKVLDATRELDLGKIRLAPNVSEIEGVNVVADQSSIQYKIDKKVVNVSQQLTSTSGSAVDILENVPSVKVDIEGNVSLRGSSSFTVLIDGRPTVLDPSDALSQIPAGAIENIEIITNPSAKYEPDGASGIINIVTKKNKLNGMSGVVNANIGRHNRYGADATIDYRNEKWHWYFGGDYNVRQMPGDMNSERWTELDDGTIRYLNADGTFIRGKEGGSLRGGFDWSVTENDVIGLAIRGGSRDRLRGSNLDYEDFIDDETPLFYSTEQETSSNGLFYSLSLNYKHNFKQHKEHFIEVQAIVDGSDAKEESITESDTLGFVYEGRKTTEDGPGRGYRFMLDYSLPLPSGDKIETGAHLRISDSHDENGVYDLDTDTDEYILVPQYSDTTSYTRNTYAVYGIYGGERGNFGYKAGLRMEYTYRLLELINTDTSYTIDRPDFFPTIHFSYKLPSDQELMLSYTRRIVRPRGHYLEPFYTWVDANNKRIGNPELEPEYVNSFDLGYQKKIKQNFIALEGYYRITQNKIEKVTTPLESDPNINLQTYENVGTDYALGVELTFNYSPTKWYTINLMGDLYDYRLVGELYDVSYDQHDFSWNGRMNNTFKASKSTRFQVDFSYRSPRIQAQGTYEGFFTMSAAIKQDLFKRKVSATLQVRDVLGGMKHESTTSGVGFEQYNLYSPNTPIVMLSISYKMNNYRTKRGGRSNGDDESDEGDEY